MKRPLPRMQESVSEPHSDIEALKKRVASVLNGYSEAEIRSLTGYPYLMEAVKDAIGYRYISIRNWYDTCKHWEILHQKVFPID